MTSSKILHSAKQLFWQHGIRRVSVEEISREAGISKMTFYRSFNNKNEVAEKIFEEVMSQNMQQYKNIMKQQVPFPERIMQAVELNHKWSEDISKEFLKDVQNDKLGLAKKLEAAQQESREVFKKDLKAAQRKGWIRKDYKIEFIMYMLNSLNEKIMDEKFLLMFKDVQDAIMESTNFFFYGLMAKEDERA